jgi:hypothetical protein
MRLALMVGEYCHVSPILRRAQPRGAFAARAVNRFRKYFPTTERNINKSSTRAMTFDPVGQFVPFTSQPKPILLQGVGLEELPTPVQCAWR